MSTPDWLPGLFQAIDRNDADAFAAHLDEQALFRLGNARPVTGGAAIREAAAAFFAAVRCLIHREEERWSAGDAVICHGTVTYGSHGGSSLALPFANNFKLRGSLIGEHPDYVDVAPRFCAAWGRSSILV